MVVLTQGYRVLSMRKLDEDSYIAPLFLVGVFLISLTYFIVKAAI